MSRAFVSALVTLVVSSLLTGCTAPRGEGIEIRDAWMRPATQGANGAVYLVVQNDSSAEDEITGVSVEAAEVAEIHESVMDGDVMQMHQLSSVPLPAGDEVMFEPGGLHIMLIRLKQDLNEGDGIEVILHFRSYEDLKISVSVRETPAGGSHPVNTQ